MESKTTDLAETKEALFKRITEDPRAFGLMCDHVANGGTLVDLAERWGIGFNHLSVWINEDLTRAKAMGMACKQRDDWALEVVLREIRSIALADIRKLYDQDNNLLPTTQWPDDIARAVEGVETEQIFEQRDGERHQIGQTKKVRLAKKDKLLLALGKDLGRFVEKHEHFGEISLVDVLEASYKSVESVEDND